MLVDSHTTDQNQSLASPEQRPLPELPRAVTSLEQAFSAISTHGERVRPPLAELQRLATTDVLTFKAELLKTFASAPRPPSTDTASTLLMETMLHLEATVHKELQTMLPALQAIQEQVARISPDGDFFLRLVSKLIDTVTTLPPEHAEASFSHKIAEYTRALRHIDYIAVRSKQILALVSTSLEAAEIQPSQTPSDPAIWRQTAIAIDLYERSRHKGSDVCHVPEHSSVVPHNLQAQLPPLYALDSQALTRSLAQVTRDESLAQSLSSHLIRATEAYHIWFLTIQGILGLSLLEMQRVEKFFPLEPLYTLVTECRACKNTCTLLARALTAEIPGLDTLDSLSTWARHLRSYCATLTPFELQVPV